MPKSFFFFLNFSANKIIQHQTMVGKKNAMALESENLGLNPGFLVITAV